MLTMGSTNDYYCNSLKFSAIIDVSKIVLLKKKVVLFEGTIKLIEVTVVNVLLRQMISVTMGHSTI